MSLEYSFTQFHMKFKNAQSGRAYGVSEAYQMAPGLDRATKRARGKLLCQLRSLFLPEEILIGTCVAKDSNVPNKTVECLNDGPIAGAYGKTNNIKVVTGANGSLGNLTVQLGSAESPVVESDPQDELLIEHAEICSFFRFESVDSDHKIRWFHGIPSIWMADGIANDLADDFSWLTGATISSAPAVVKNLWENYQPFFDYLKQYYMFVQPNAIFDPAASGGGDTTKPYRLSALDSVIYKKLDDAPVGKPYDVEVGRHF